MLCVNVCRSELIDSAWVVIVPGQKCIKTPSFYYICYMQAYIKYILSSGYSEWTMWSNCSKECGYGERNQTRECMFKNKKSCESFTDTEKKELCNKQPCTGKYNNLCWTRMIWLVDSYHLPIKDVCPQHKNYW